MNKDTSKRARAKRIATEILNNWNEIYWWKRVPFRKLLSLCYQKIIGNKGIYVMEEDWDNLIILDACRYDTFIEVTKKKADYRISRGSNTTEFLKENFLRKKYNDTVIVAANPNVYKIRGRFHKTIPVWKDGWNEEFQTVMPETMFEYAINANKQFPSKRLIIWFLQPHHPFIGDPELCNYGVTRIKRMEEIFFPRAYAREDGKSKLGVISPWVDADKGKIEIQKVWKAYSRNLEIVIPYAYKLAYMLSGKTVITSDHGNAFKSLTFPPIKIVGHPEGIYISELVKVPWLEIESGERRKTIMAVSDEEIILKKRISKIKKLAGLSA